MPMLCKRSALVLLAVCSACCPHCSDIDLNKVFSSSDKNPVDRKRTKRKAHHWVIDSGATIHCVGDPSLLTSIYYDHKSVGIKVTDNRVIYSHAVGTAVIPLEDKAGNTQDVVLHNVVYHPSFHSNLLSVRRLWRDSRLQCKFDPHNYIKCKYTGTKFPFRYEAQYRMPTVNLVSGLSAIDFSTMHRRFGHCSRRRLCKLKERSMRCPAYVDNPKYDHTDCDACNAGGAKRKPFKKRDGNPYKYFGERLSSDLCGPFPKSIDGYTYMLNIVDGYTNELAVYFLRSKSSSEVKTALEQYLVDNKPFLPTNQKPVNWHTDNGGEFLSSDLDEFCQEFAVKRSFSIPYAPPQNSHAERMWGIVLRPLRIMLAQSKVHSSFWTYAAQHACMLHNYLPSTRLAGEISPYQAKYAVAPDVSKVRVWGCTCWYYLPEHERKSKISARAVPAIHLGMDQRRNGYVIYVPSLHRITSAHHIVFQERKFLTFTEEGIVNKPNSIRPLRDREPLHRNSPSEEYNETRDESTNEEHVEPCDHPDCTLPKHSVDEPHSHELRPTRDRGPNPPRYPEAPSPNYVDLLLRIDDVCDMALAIRPEDMLSDIETPQSYSQAINSRSAPRWIESMNREIEDLVKHGTWELIERKDVPKSHRVTKSKWVYKIKLNKDGSIERFKSRFVVCGYSQIEGVDYTHSFSATMRATSFRLLLALAAGEKLKLEHFDVTNAFTQSDIDSDIYVEPPKGYEQSDAHGDIYVLKLRKALYGTKQASRMWQLKLRSHLVNYMGFSNSSNDPCLFLRRDSDGSVLIVGVYVDDIILAHNGKRLKWFVDKFTGPAGFRAKHIGPLSWFLGVSVEQKSDLKVHISQTQYVQKLVDKFISTKPASAIKHSMPCNPLNFPKLSTAQTDSERARAAKLPYLQVIGSLLYLSTMTRPDIAYHMATLCSLMHDPTVEAYHAALDLLLYVYSHPYTLSFWGTRDIPIGVDAKHHNNIRTNGGLVGFSDSTWRSASSKGYNLFGYVFYFMGAPVSYISKHLRVVALSSAEAEYAAASYACKEIVFIRNVLTDLGFKISSPTVLAVDNKAAISIAENLGVTARNKHFNDAIHYFRHLVDHRIVVPTHVVTKYQRADGFTKCLSKTPYREWFKLLMMHDVRDSQS